MPNGYSIYTKKTRHAICDYCGMDIRHFGAGKLEGYAARHVQFCRHNPANGYCETCVHARFYRLDMHCAHLNKMMIRSKAPHPCEGYTTTTPEGVA